MEHMLREGQVQGVMSCPSPGPSPGFMGKEEGERIETGGRNTSLSVSN